MGGEISVKSRVGEGSVFTFTATFGISPDSVEARRLPEGLIGLHALVVDDNESARLALAGMLEMLACRVDTAGSGDEALKAFRKATESEPYRVALIDWKMPGLDGIETSTRLREMAGASPLGLILVTAYDWDEAARRAEDAGIETVLHKPLSPSALHDALVSTLMPGERLRSPAPSPALTTFVPGQTVLLVEDQAINRELARELLTQAGLLVREAANGAEALRFLEDQKPDVVLMDVQMPDMDGLTAVGRIRENPELKGLPVIAMTAHAMLGDRERFLAAGMSDYVAKPIEEAQLFRVLGRWLKAELLTHAAPGRESVETETRSSARPLAALDRAAGLRRAGGNAALFDRLVRAFVAEAPEMAARIRRKTIEGDPEGARRELHTLKGNAATVSALETAALAGALERNPEGSLPIPALDDLDRAIARLGLELGAVTVVAAKTSPEQPVQPLGLEGRAALRAALRKVADHVAKGNLAARRSFEEVERASAGNFAAPLRSIGEALARLDFASAAAEIETLESQLASMEEA